MSAAPYLADDAAYSPAVQAWARAEARVRLLAAFLDEHGALDAEGKPRPALEALYRHERLALDQRSRLGLDPLARARLGRDVAASRLDLARLWADEPAPEANDDEEES